MCNVVLELRRGWADVIHHELQTQLHEAEQVEHSEQSNLVTQQV